MWWHGLIPILGTTPLWVYNVRMLLKMRRRKQEQKAERARIDAERQRIPYTGLEPLALCLGCDELRPASWMAFVDEDGDGQPDALYRCRVCRGVPDPVESQAACDERVEEHFANLRGDDTTDWEIGPGKVVEVHEDSCQCSNCVGYKELTQEQIENARINNGTLDLSKMFVEYSAAVEGYRRAGVDATNETNRKYNKRIAQRRAAREQRVAELRAKYDMDGNGWRNYARRA